MKSLRCCWLAGCSLLAACTVGPNYKAPRADLPPGFTEAKEPPPPHDAGQAPRIRGDLDPDPAWWQVFNDPELNRLEQRLLAENFDLKTGLLNIEQARLQVISARAQGLPTLKGTASYSREQLGLAGILDSQHITSTPGSAESSLLSSVETPINLYQLGFDASWELDLFGKVRRSVEGAKAQLEEQVESRRDMMVSLQAEVASDYLQLRAAQMAAAVTRSSIASSQEILKLTQDQQSHGLASQADVESAAGQLASLQAGLPQYLQQTETERHAVAVLLAQPPTALDQELGEGALPALPPQVPVGLPAALARRRPDIRQAEAGVHAATAQIGVAVASLFPDVSLSGMVGLRNLSTGYLFKWASKFYQAGPSVSVPIFQGGSLLTQVKIAHVQEAAAILSYRKTVLSALQDVEDGLVAIADDEARSHSLAEYVGSEERALEINTHSFRTGLIPYLNVLNSQTQRDQARLQQVQAESQQLADLVKLYKALGGGWNVPDPAVAREQ